MKKHKTNPRSVVCHKISDRCSYSVKHIVSNNFTACSLYRFAKTATNLSSPRHGSTLIFHQNKFNYFSKEDKHIFQPFHDIQIELSYTSIRVVLSAYVHVYHESNFVHRSMNPESSSHIILSAAFWKAEESILANRYRAVDNRRKNIDHCRRVRCRLWCNAKLPRLNIVAEKKLPCLYSAFHKAAQKTERFLAKSTGLQINENVSIEYD